MNHHPLSRRHRALALSLVAFMALAACSDSNSVGSDDLLAGTDDANGDGLRLGETTTTVTTAPPAADNSTPDQTAAAPVQTTTAPVQTTTAPVQTTAAPQVAIEILIQSDTADGQFKPRVVQVVVGSIVAFRNTDSVVHSVEGDGGIFSSGDIAPGATWKYTANQPGEFNYTDGTRPYAVGTLQVVTS